MTTSKESRTCPTCGNPFLSYKTPGNERIYCSRSCVPKVDKKPVVCAGCGKEFLTYDKKRNIKYCSKECRATVKSTTYICNHCGKEFPGFTKTKRYFCSLECKSAAKRMDTTCPNCGKTFWCLVSHPRIYCCRACSAAVNAKKNLGIIELPQQFCEQCGNEITQDKRTGRRFCSATCFGAWMSIYNIGEAHPTYNQVDRTCKQCGDTFKAQPSEVAKGWGNFCCRSCAAQWHQINNPNVPLPPVMCGSDNPRWKGGYLPYYGESWRSQRRIVRERDNFTCQRCGITESELGRELDVHHIQPFRTFGVDNHLQANRSDNLISLCNVCHLITENQP